MAYTKESTVNEVMSGKPQAKALMEKYMGRPIGPGEIEMAGGMSLDMVSGYVGWSREKTATILKELNAL